VRSTPTATFGAAGPLVEERVAVCTLGFYAAPTYVNEYAASIGTVLAAVRLIGAWDASNPWRRSALVARLEWCLIQDGAGASPCDKTLVILADGVQWAWAGWFDVDTFLIAADRGTGPNGYNATAGGWAGPVVVERGCSGTT
jgi:hypothetical protein